MSNSHAAHAALHVLKHKEAQAAALAAGAVAVKAGAVLLATPALGPAAVVGGVGYAGYRLVKWLSK